MCNAIIFSVYIPSHDKVYILTELLEAFKNNFINTDIFIGINRPYCTEVIEEIIKYKDNFNIIYEISDDHIVTKCDISGYQTALMLLKNSKKNYDLIWFVHTKGVTSNRHSIRKELINTFFINQCHIIKIFESNPNIGTYSKYIIKYDGPEYFNDVLSQFYKNFKLPYFYTYWYAYTFYVMRGSGLHEFINNCEQSFFTSNLIKEKKCDRYFFERDFPHIIWRQNMLPEYSYYESWNYGYANNTFFDDCKGFFSSINESID